MVSKAYILRVSVFLIAWIIGFKIPLQAVEPFHPRLGDPIENPLYWQNYVELMAIDVRCMAEDMDGAIWFGTNRKGVFRYDGIHLQSMGLVGYSVHTLFISSDGNLYAGNDRGFFQYEDNKWKYQLPSEEQFFWFVTDICETRDRGLWISTAWGALNIYQNIYQLFTTKEHMEGLKVLFPGIKFYIVPETMALKQRWINRLGLDVVTCGVLDTLAFIRSIASDGPAALAGLKIGDRIKAVNGIEELIEDQFEGETGTT